MELIKFRSFLFSSDVLSRHLLLGVRQQLLGIRHMTDMASRIKPVVVSGPSGCGKSTLIKRMMVDHPGKFGFSVSHTTRLPRPGEVDGKDYHYTDRASMQQAIEAGEFIESAEFSNNLYGTSRKSVQDVLDKGLVCLMDIDSQGVKNIKKTDLDCLLIFVRPPSMDELEKRLRGRGTETEDAIQRRLGMCKSEMEYAAQPGVYHYTVVNDKLDQAYIDFEEIVRKETGHI